MGILITFCIMIIVNWICNFWLQLVLLTSYIGITNYYMWSLMVNHADMFECIYRNIFLIVITILHIYKDHKQEESHKQNLAQKFKEQQQYKALLDQFQEGVILSSINGCIMYQNKYSKDFYFRNNKDDILEKCFIKVDYFKLLLETQQ